MTVEQPSLLANVQPLQSRSARGLCSHCGQKLPRIFKHVLSKGLINVLWHLYQARRPVKLVDLPIDHSTFANAQKVGYFGLARSIDGYWELTERGLLFLGNRVDCERYVFTKSGNVVERSAETIRVANVDAGWWKKLDYANAARSAS